MLQTVRPPSLRAGISVPLPPIQQHTHVATSSLAGGRAGSQMRVSAVSEGVRAAHTYSTSMYSTRRSSPTRASGPRHAAPVADGIHM